MSSPESNVLFVDWSTFTARRDKYAIPIVLVMLDRLRDVACRSVFGLVLVCGMMDDGGRNESKEGVLILKSNESAMDVLQLTLGIYF